MTDFTDGFAAQARAGGVQVVHNGSTYDVREADAENARAGAYLEVALNGEVVGYFTEYANYESGAVRAHLLGLALPQVFNTVEDALDFLVPDPA